MKKIALLALTLVLSHVSAATPQNLPTDDAISMSCPMRLCLPKAQ